MTIWNQFESVKLLDSICGFFLPYFVLYCSLESLQNKEKFIIMEHGSSVLRNLAKVEVEGSNPFARSKLIVNPYFFEIVCNAIPSTFFEQTQSRITLCPN